ncbi:MAG: glycine cleavage system aminomethyltransferase GcvT [Muribaculaceae bacterium]|jgi:aminomethyltransferase
MESNDKKTCLHACHVALGAQMMPFGGFDMPIEYSGLDAEHRAVRESVGVFDVSHMGEVRISGKDALRFVNHIFCNDIESISDGQILYGMMLYPDGGTVDDLLVYRVAEDDYFLVFNASNIDKDIAWMHSCAEAYDVKIEDQCDIYGEIAVQGPDSERTLREVLGIEAADLAFYTFKSLGGNPEVIVSRTGYTGEDGFEIYAAPADIVSMWEKLMAAGVTPCGLGCRDTLRFEAGLPLYGDELAADISPVEAALGMFVKLDKPEFIGREAIARQKEQGVSRKIVGLEIEGQATARHGFEVLDTDDNVIGSVTTGYNSITLGKNLAMAMVDIAHAALGTQLKVRIRRRVVPATVIKKRFYTPNYKK